jgi:putative DNA primase/helicase
MGVNTIAIPFNKTLIHKDLMAKLKGELPCILSWAIEGCLLWQEEEVDNLGRGW